MSEEILDQAGMSDNYWFMDSYSFGRFVPEIPEGKLRGIIDAQERGSWERLEKLLALKILQDRVIYGVPMGLVYDLLRKCDADKRDVIWEKHLEKWKIEENRTELLEWASEAHDHDFWVRKDIKQGLQRLWKGIRASDWWGQFGGRRKVGELSLLSLRFIPRKEFFESVGIHTAFYFASLVSVGEDVVGEWDG